MLLENTRFRKEEDTKDKAAQAPFAKELASLADVFVNDAFGTAHRHHASTAGVADYIPAVMGFLIEKELKYLGEALDTPKRPLVAILGGAKVADKIAVIESLLAKADTILIGGGMAFTFLKAQGVSIGKSLLDADGIDFAGSMIERAKEAGVSLLLPTDTLAAEAFENDAPSAVFETNEGATAGIPDNMMGLDIGPETIKTFVDVILNAGTILWNGPMGVFEMPNFAKGTLAVAGSMADATDAGAVSIVGGGDSAAAVAQFGFAERMSHVSTGGGASLEFIEGKKLPGVEALNEK
jgi:3-phosphoglycerate kinase